MNIPQFNGIFNFMIWKMFISRIILIVITYILNFEYSLIDSLVLAVPNVKVLMLINLMFDILIIQIILY